MSGQGEGMNDNCAIVMVWFKLQQYNFPFIRGNDNKCAYSGIINFQF